MTPIIFRRNLAWGSAYAAHSQAGAAASNASCMHAEDFTAGKGTDGHEPPKCIKVVALGEGVSHGRPHVGLKPRPLAQE